MADYDWGPDCGCGFMQPHDRLCASNRNYELNKKIDAEIARERTRGFVYLGDMKGNRTQMIWGCRRGCGCVVWDTDTHIENVCREFNPIAAS